MPKSRVQEQFFDFTGGLNTNTNPDLLQRNELVRLDDCRVEDDLGVIAKRQGSRRLHSSAIGGGNAVTGVFQWTAPSGLETVAVANGKFYHRQESSGTFSAFTEKTPSPAFSTSTNQTFATFRNDTSGAALKLYIADGSVVYEWDGTSLSQVDGTNAFPNAEILEPYHTRMFANDPEFKKNLFWSDVGDATTWNSSGVTGGGNALVDLLSGEAITALETAGGALLVCTEDSISRFLGYSSDDIRIAQDTEGVSNAIGVPGAHAITGVEKQAVLLSDVGPYFATQNGVTAIGVKVEDEFFGLDRTRLDEAYVVPHKARRSIWFFVPGSGDSDLQTAYEYNLRLQSWSGPYSYPFRITCAAAWEDQNGDEFVITGGNDGFVRHMDTGWKDDVTSAGTGGSTYNMLAELRPVTFGDPGRLKTLHRVFPQATVSSNESPDVEISVDGGSFATGNTFTGSDSSDIVSYRVDDASQGSRFRFRLRDGSSDEAVTFHGITIEAFDMQRSIA